MLLFPRPAVDFSLYRRIVFFTGAGISAASVVLPAGGQARLYELATAGAWAQRPLEVLELFSAWEAQLETIGPTAAHRALAELEGLLGPDQSLTVITQNLDGLHQKAGNCWVLEVHGALGRRRCSDPACGLPVQPAGGPGFCPRCGARLRPDVVLFGEDPYGAVWDEAVWTLKSCDLLVIVGTSLSVAPARYLVWLPPEGTPVVLVNPERTAGDSPATHWIRKRAEKALPAWVAQWKRRRGRP